MVTQSSVGGYRYGNQRADKRPSTYQLTEEDEFGLSGRTPGLNGSSGRFHRRCHRDLWPRALRFPAGCSSAHLFLTSTIPMSPTKPNANW
jgi:hypothetical protein